MKSLCKTAKNGAAVLPRVFVDAYEKALKKTKNVLNFYAFKTPIRVFPLFLLLALRFAFAQGYSSSLWHKTQYS